MLDRRHIAADRRPQIGMARRASAIAVVHIAPIEAISIGEIASVHGVEIGDRQRIGTRVGQLRFRVSRLRGRRLTARHREQTHSQAPPPLPRGGLAQLLFCLHVASPLSSYSKRELWHKREELFASGGVGGRAITPLDTSEPADPPQRRGSAQRLPARQSSFRA